MSGSDVYVHAITNISIVLGALQKPSGDAKIQAGTDSRAIDIDGEQSFRADFDSPLETSSAHNLKLTVQWSWKDRYREGSVKQEKIAVSSEELQANSRKNGDDRELRIEYGKVKIAILYKTKVGSKGNETGITEGLTPEVEKIIEICPRFRILIVGKAGVGKTSLIKHAFGVDEANISHYQPGVADINNEYMPKDNERFVLHDSRGFEPGDESNFQAVRDFIDERKSMVELKDKLHAVWLCFSTPRAGERILETGSEKFLDLKLNGALGDIPIIAVYTKYDNLVARAKRILAKSRQTGGSLGQESPELANQRDSCVVPLRRIVGDSVPYSFVSTKPGFEKTLVELVNLTYGNVTKHVSEDASLVSAIAQRVNPKLKIDGSISVGARKYWVGLASSANFSGYTIQDCLEVVHEDIIKIWNFNDEYRHLHSYEFKKMMMGMADDSYNSIGGNAIPPSSFSTSIVSAASLIGSIAARSPFLVVGGLVCKWAFDTYSNSGAVLQRFMKYIIDLTLVMQTLFGLVAGSQVHLTRRLIKTAFLHYRNSKEKNSIHYEIQQHVRNTGFRNILSQDPSLEKIVEIIKAHPIKPEEMSKLRMEAKNVHEQSDELWFQV